MKSIERLELEEFDTLTQVGSAIFDDYMDLIKDVKVQLEAQIGTTQISVGEISKLQENSVLKLDTDLSQPVNIMLNGKVIARGSLAAVDDNFAIQITEITKK